MTMQTHNTDVAILNMEPGDEVLHGNVLMVYEDQQDSPSCTAAVVGHLLRFADQEAVPFESGTLITTVPFRIETSRLGKPVEQVTHDDLASLKAKYQLRPDTPFTMVLRKDVTAPPEQLFAHDIQHYAKTYYENRIGDIETVFLAAEAQAQSLRVQPESPVCLLFGLEGLLSERNRNMNLQMIEQSPLVLGAGKMWPEATSGEFLSAIRDSNLPSEAFQRWLVQDMLSPGDLQRFKRSRLRKRRVRRRKF